MQEEVKAEMLDEKGATRVLITLCLASFLVPFMGSSINLALPQISEDLSMKAVTLTWMSTAYLISTAIFQIPFARMADLIGRRRTFMMGVAIFSILNILSGFATTTPVMLSLRFLAGMGSAMMFGTGTAILTSVFSGEKRGWALGINAATVYAALAVGPFVGGFITEYMGWRSIFFISAAIGIVVFVLTQIFFKEEWIEAKGESFDWVGSILYGVGLMGVIFGFSNLPSTMGFIAIGVGLVVLVLFGHYELRHESPVFNIRLFTGSRIFTLSSLAALINYAATAAIGFMLSLYLQYVRDLEPTKAGLILISQAVVQALFSLASARLSSRFEPSRLATVGMLIIVVGLAGLLTLSPTTPFAIIIMLLMLLGAGFGIFSAPNTNVIMSSVERQYYSQASASTGTMRLTGQVFSIGIAGMAISFTMGNEKIIPALYPSFMTSMHLTFGVFLVLCLVGVYFSWSRQSSRQNI